MQTSNMKFRIWNMVLVFALMLGSVVIAPAPVQAQEGQNNLFLPLVNAESSSSNHAMQRVKTASIPIKHIGIEAGHYSHDPESGSGASWSLNSRSWASRYRGWDAAIRSMGDAVTAIQPEQYSAG